MTTDPTITRINLEDQSSQEALAVERRLFAHYDLAYKEHYLQMDEPDLRLRVSRCWWCPAAPVMPGRRLP